MGGGYDFMLLSGIDSKQCEQASNGCQEMAQRIKTGTQTNQEKFRGGFAIHGFCNPNFTTKYVRRQTNREARRNTEEERGGKPPPQKKQSLID
jgi:hypothetical protein